MRYNYVVSGLLVNRFISSRLFTGQDLCSFLHTLIMLQNATDHYTLQSLYDSTFIKSSVSKRIPIALKCVSKRIPGHVSKRIPQVESCIKY